MTTISASAPVLVTGASGYIAGWIVKYLLEAGHKVHGTVRDPAKRKGLEHLHAMSAQFPGMLTLFKADLLENGAYDPAMHGCELVMHTASPFVISGFTDANEALVRPAVEGTRNVLASCNRVASVKRVVLTSSIASVFGDNCESQNKANGTFTEDDWNTSSSVDHQPYSYSKVMAEKAAWEMQKAQSRWDMVTINPGFVLGPSLTTTSASTSIDTMKQLGGGPMRFGAPKLTMAVVDVRDVAIAHIKAGFTPTASGRHITNAQSVTMLQLGKILAAKFGKNYPFPKSEAPKPLIWLIAPIFGLTRKFVSTNMNYPLKLDNSRSIKNLGLKYRPIEETLTEHFQQMLDDGQIAKR